MWAHVWNSIREHSLLFIRLIHFISFYGIHATFASKNLIPSRVRVRLICLFVCSFDRAWLTLDVSYLDQYPNRKPTFNFYSFHFPYLFVSNEHISNHNQFWNFIKTRRRKRNKCTFYDWPPHKSRCAKCKRNF